MALYRAPRVFETTFNLENYLDVNASQSFIGYAKLSAINVFERSTTFLSEVIVTARLSVTDLNVINTFLGYEINIFGGLKAPIQAQLDGIIAAGTYTSTISIADTVTLPAGEPAAVENLGTSTNAYLKFSIPQGIQGDPGDPGAPGSMGPTGATGTVEPVGSRGDIGYTGPVGAPGTIGPVGPTGDRGSSGLSGRDGSATNTGATGCTGCTVPIGERGPAGYAVSTGATGCTGERGAQGERGEPGEAGGQGERGEQGEKGKNGSNGKDGSSFEGGFTDFIASSVFTLAISGLVAAGVAVYMGANTLAEALEKAAYATIAYVDGRVRLFTAFGAEYIGTQYCNGSLTIRSILDNTIILNNDGNSIFKNQVDFRNDITVQGDILNKSSDYSLDIKATGNDLNLTSTTSAINLYGGSRIALNAPEVINSGDLKVNSLKPIAATDDLNIGHDTIVCTPETVLKVNTISEMYDVAGNPSNLTITNPKLIVNNKICVNELTYFNAANDALDISHSVVNILGTLKTDEITSLRDPDNLVDPTELQIKHEIVTIPEQLKVDRLRSLVDPAVGQTIPSELNINHDLVRVEEILLVNKIETSSTTEQLEANPAMKTTLEITHEEVRINHQLKIDEIDSIRETGDLLNPTELQITHEVVKIPESLKVDRISSVTVPPVTNPRTETSLSLAHDNVIVSHNLKVDKIIPNTVPYPAHPYTELQLTHNYVQVSEILETNSIRAITSADTIGIEGKIINLLAPGKTNVIDPDSEVTITADKSSIRGKKIYIGNYDGTSEIHIIGNCHFYNTQNENAFWNEVDGFFQQNGI